MADHRVTFSGPNQPSNICKPQGSEWLGFQPSFPVVRILLNGAGHEIEVTNYNWVSGYPNTFTLEQDTPSATDPDGGYTQTGGTITADVLIA